jgi:thiol:disulfide interchange protein DsbD
MSKLIKGTLSLLCAAFLAVPSLPAQQSETLETQHVKATLITEKGAFRPGEPITVGLLLDHAPGWHTYWKSTATGYATSLQWTLPDGFEAGPIAWPTPTVYDFMGTIEYVYEDEALLLTTIRTPASWDGSEARIRFTADWLMCADTCIPATVEGSLEIPAAEAGAPLPPGPRPDLFAETRRRLPTGPGPYELNAWREDGAVLLRVEGNVPPDLVYFDATGQLRPERSATPVQSSAAGTTLRLEKSAAAEAVPARLKGVLRAGDGWPALERRPGLIVDVPVAADPPPGTVSAEPGSGSAATGLPTLLALAFAGGLILNLMPCVFPVLGIKVMGFVSQAGEERRRVISHGLVFTAGVLLSFWLLAAVLLALRSGGEELGWGFQLQSPVFVFLLALFLLAFALNMSGLFEIGQSAVGVGSNLTGKGGFAGSFFSGILATVVATPCAAPFLAPALGAALALPPATSVLLFTAIALGLATPYLLLSAFPGLVRRLPRPGPWMETFKQVMSFLLYGTVAYLVWVLAGQLTEEAGYSAYAFLKALFALVLLALGLYTYGRWGAFHRPKTVRRISMTAALLLCLGAVVYGLPEGDAERAKAAQLDWQKWEPGKARELAASGRPAGA